MSLFKRPRSTMECEAGNNVVNGPSDLLDSSLAQPPRRPPKRSAVDVDEPAAKKARIGDEPCDTRSSTRSPSPWPDNNYEAVSSVHPTAQWMSLRDDIRASLRQSEEYTRRGHSRLPSPAPSDSSSDQTPSDDRTEPIDRISDTTLDNEYETPCDDTSSEPRSCQVQEPLDAQRRPLSAIDGESQHAFHPHAQPEGRREPRTRRKNIKRGGTCAMSPPGRITRQSLRGKIFYELDSQGRARRIG